uniref:Uncharacterized protein n=1 Tax=Anguilla anguilla TaxID=7936 RepID=A0A0E9RS71_ANGAN
MYLNHTFLLDNFSWKL